MAKKKPMLSRYERHIRRTNRLLRVTNDDAREFVSVWIDNFGKSRVLQEAVDSIADRIIMRIVEDMDKYKSNLGLEIACGQARNAERLALEILAEANKRNEKLEKQILKLKARQ